MIRSLLQGLATTTVVAGAVVVAVGYSSADEAVVIKHVDGDTFDVVMDGEDVRIRMLNIDTPETKHPERGVECMGPEAAAFLTEVIPLGSTVTLKYDVERTDRFDRTLAAVYSGETFVNAEVARAGLGRAVVFGKNDRYLEPVENAQEEAAAAGRGLYSSDMTCTVPAQAAAVSTAAVAVQALPVPPASASSAELAAASVQVAGAVSSVALLAESVLGDRSGVAWAVLPARQQERLRSDVTAAVGRAQTVEQSLASATRDAQAREAEAARVAAEAEAARVAEAAHVAAEAEAARLAAAQEAAAAEAARAAEQQRLAKEAARRAQAPRPAPRNSAPPPPPASNPYPGYTGPRCYDPGGQTWHPCP